MILFPVTLYINYYLPLLHPYLFVLTQTGKIIVSVVVPRELLIVKATPYLQSPLVNFTVTLDPSKESSVFADNAPARIPPV